MASIGHHHRPPWSHLTAVLDGALHQVWWQSCISWCSPTNTLKKCLLMCADACVGWACVHVGGGMHVTQYVWRSEDKLYLFSLLESLSSVCYALYYRLAGLSLPSWLGEYWDHRCLLPHLAFFFKKKNIESAIKIRSSGSCEQVLLPTEQPWWSLR